MALTVVLDSGPLGFVTHPRDERRQNARKWLITLASGGMRVVLPEIVDYEHRRKLLHLGSTGSLRHLDALKSSIAYAPLTTDVMLRAARLWAEARRQGMPTASERALDVDVIFAAQAMEFAEDGNGVVVATTNPRHLSRFVDAHDWREITSV